VSFSLGRPLLMGARPTTKMLRIAYVASSAPRPASIATKFVLPDFPSPCRSRLIYAYLQVPEAIAARLIPFYKGLIAQAGAVMPKSFLDLSALSSEETDQIETNTTDISEAFAE
jgi:hypothetical protein